MPGKKSRDKSRLRDSGSSGNDKDRSSGSRKSGGTERMVRKPSKELLKVQNLSDSTDDDEAARFSTSKRSNSRRGNSSQKSSQDQADSQETGNDDQCGLSSTSKEQSPSARYKMRKSPSYGQNKSPRTAKKSSRKSSENTSHSNASSSTQQHTCKSLNNQIKEYIKSPSKSRKLSTFDAFNHTSSLKLSHAHNSQERPSFDNQGKYDEYYEYYHPRRSSREVLDFTSKRKSQKDLTKLDEDIFNQNKRNSLKGGGDNSSKEEADNNADSLKRKKSNLF